MLRTCLFVGLASMLAASTGALAQTPLGTAFTYQGRLDNAGAPANGLHDLEFRLFDAASGGAQVGPTVCLDNVSVVDGLFTVQVDFGSQYVGAGRWVQIGVRADASGSIACGSGTLTPLTGRQALTAAPYALALPGLWTQNNATSPNIIGGFSGNSVAPGVVGAVVAGGGTNLKPNQVNATFGVVGGGFGNTAVSSFSTAGGGINNSASAVYSVVGGGETNTAGGSHSTVGGGYGNTASGTASTVAGGYFNTASGVDSTVAGGYFNTAGGYYSYAAGRRAIVRTPAQSGDFDGDEGTFVWADTQNADFISTGSDQFLIRAAGGVGIGTPNPSNQLTVAGNADFTGSVGIGTVSPSSKLEVRGASDTEISITNNTPDAHRWTLQSSNGSASGQLASSFQIIDRTVGASRVLIDANGKVGIGTIAPDQTLSVFGNASKPGGGSWAAFSDPRLKHDIRPMSGTLDKLLSLHGYFFEYNADAVASGKGLPGRQIGLMADEVEQIFPDWVSRNDEGYRSVTERATTALMVESLRDLRAEKDAEIARLRAEKDAQIHDLSERLARLEAIVVSKASVPPARQ